MASLFSPLFLHSRSLPYCPSTFSDPYRLPEAIGFFALPSLLCGAFFLFVELLSPNVNGDRPPRGWKDATVGFRHAAMSLVPPPGCGTQLTFSTVWNPTQLSPSITLLPPVLRWDALVRAVLLAAVEMRPSFHHGQLLFPCSTDRYLIFLLFW